MLEDGAEAKPSAKKKASSKTKDAKAEASSSRNNHRYPRSRLFRRYQILKQSRSENAKEPAAAIEESLEEEAASASLEKSTGTQSEQADADIDIHEATVYYPVSATGARVVPASPSVRRTAREIGIDIADVPGSGPGGRITVEDVKEFARMIHRGGAPAGGQAIAAPHLPDFSRWGPVERKPMSNIREKTAERMAIAWSNVPTVTQYDKADITRLEEYRKNFGSKAEASGGKLTVTAVLLKVIASGLKNFPEFNASVDVTRKDIIYKKYFHVGVAVDTDRGLLVPVIRDVDRKNILQLSVELTQLAEKARNRKLTLEEMQGGTFTITNLGGIGGTGFSPIVNFPEVAILGISRSNVEPVYVNGEFEPRTMLPLSLSYDHRMIDGANAARFLRWVCEAIRDPFLVALEG